MTWNGFLYFFIFLGLVLSAAQFLGVYLYKVYGGNKTLLDPILKPIERLMYKICCINPQSEQHWSVYAGSAIAITVVSVLLTFIILLFQGMLPLNPNEFKGVDFLLALNTAISFATNTNWQAYAGESTLSYFSQSSGLSVQNFVSAATGIAVSVAAMRAFTVDSSKTIGNFWVDFTRTILWVLLPISFIVSFILVWQGVPQNFDNYVAIKTVEGLEQMIPQGPVASQEAIKHFGTNGGGFFNANSAHPYENPTALTNFLYMFLVAIIPAALTALFGRMVKDRSQGTAILTVMISILIAGFFIIYYAEAQPNPLLKNSGIDQAVSRTSLGGNMEGKEVRFGITSSALWANLTTATATGAVNAMHDSFAPTSGFVMKLNMMLGEIILGGVGAGFYGMIIFIIITVFIVGLMIGRSPEYLGKRIEAREIKVAMIAMLIAPIFILVCSSIAVLVPEAASSVSNPGPHGLGQILYNYSSAAANNGSAFAGFNANTNWHNIMTGIAMFFSRLAPMVAVLAIAGSLSEKKKLPESSRTFRTNTPLFIGLVIVVIIIIGGLTFFPALVLSSIAEHVSVINGKTF